MLVTNHLHHRVRNVNEFSAKQNNISTVSYYSEQNIQPCNPSPCGPNSQCREIDSHAVCSCLPNFIGSAPNCRPECVVSSECAQDKACVNKKCQDPCPGTCGQNARCQVVNHNPICSCSPDFTGDPFVQCVPKISKLFSYTLLELFLTVHYLREPFECIFYIFSINHKIVKHYYLVPLSCFLWDYQNLIKRKDCNFLCCKFKV